MSDSSTSQSLLKNVKTT